VLGLAADATSVEVKEAYRDLVKVWHPDRFGSDARLCAKAEDELKRINEAYTALQEGGRGAQFAAEPGRTPSSNDHHPARRPRSSAVASDDPGRLKLSAARALSICMGVGTLAVLSVAFALHRGGATETVKRGQAAPQTFGTMPSQSPGAGTIGSVTVAANRDVSAKHTRRAVRPGTKPFHVRLLSEAQSAQLNSACETQKDKQNPADYQTCLKAQVALITASPPSDLSELSGPERESLDSTCSNARRLGAPAYNRCINTQVAELASNPIRPDMSELSGADRSQVEAACRNTKERDGPAAYNRCRIRLITLLAQSK
jgi:hypothetical protein